MSTIEIPFSYEMAVAIIDGKKVATTRREAKGQIGDMFLIQDPRYDPNGWTAERHRHLFRVIEILEIDDLTIVKTVYYHLEGFDSPEAFEKTWRALHRGHFTLNKDYVVHFFGRIA